MKIIDFSQLYKYDYHVEIIEFKYHYNGNATYNCTIDGRPTNGLLYYVNVETTHDFPNRTYYFKKNDFVYFPMGAKYSSVFKTADMPDTEFNGIHIAFLLKDTSGELFKLSEDVLILSEELKKNYKTRMFEIAYLLSTNAPPMQAKVKLCELLTSISISLSEKNKSYEYQRIIEGVKFIEENFDKKITAKDAADACFLSESHFRMLFTEHFKIPPAKYINELKINKATLILKSGLYSVAEVAKMIGIDSPSYFSWFYKKHTSFNPSEVIEGN